MAVHAGPLSLRANAETAVHSGQLLEPGMLSSEQLTQLHCVSENVSINTLLYPPLSPVLGIVLENKIGD